MIVDMLMILLMLQPFVCQVPRAARAIVTEWKMALRMGGDDQNERAAKRVGVGVDKTLEERMKKFLDKWDEKVEDSEKDKTLMETLKDEVVDAQRRLGEVEHAATYSWEVALPHAISKVLKGMAQK